MHLSLDASKQSTLTNNPPLKNSVADAEFISLDRACRILGVGEFVIRQLASTPREGGGFRLEVADRSYGARRRVLYSSIVSFCDELGRTYNIRNRRRATDPSAAREDEDLLPFPLTDTIGVREACQIVGCASSRRIIRLIKNGSFDAYRLADDSGSPWRISRLSLCAWLAAFLISDLFPKARNRRERGT